MAFVLIQFKEKDGGTIGIVHKSWLTPRKTKVFWPPYQDRSSYEKAVLRGEAVNSEKWTLYDIKRIFNSYDDLQVAKKKEKLAEETSDLQTSDAEVNNSGPTKRKISRPVRYINFNDISSEEELDDCLQSTLPRPPKIKQKRLFQDSQGANAEGYYRDSGLEALIDENASILNNTDKSLPGASVSTPSASRTSTPLSTASTVTVPSTSFTSPLESREFQNKLVTYFATVIEQNKEILAILKTKSNGWDNNDKVLFKLDLPVRLPVQSFEDLDTLEQHLENEENRKSLCCYLSSLDKTNLVSSVNSALRYCLSNKVSKEFSFLGTRDKKKAFSKYNLKKTIVAAIKIAIPSATERTIEDHIKNWLKRAPKNYELEQKKIQKDNPDGI